MLVKPFHIIAGNDEFLVSRRGQEIWDTISKDVLDDFGREVINGHTGNVAEVEQVTDRFVSAVQTLPMFGNRKCVWFQAVNFLADSVTGRAEGTQVKVEQLISILSNLDPGQVSVLITASPVDRRRKPFKNLSSLGDCEFIDPRQQDDTLYALIEKEAGNLGSRFCPDAVNLLLGLVGSQPRLAIEETRKLATWLGQQDGEILPEMVTELVPPFGEGDFFEAGEAFFSLDLEWTLAAIRRHFFAGHNIRPLLATLQNRNRLLIQLRVLLDAGAISQRISKSSIDKALNYYGQHFGKDAEKSAFNVFSQNPWYLGRLVGNAKNIPLRGLIDFQVAFLRAFEESVMRPSEAESIMRSVAIQCLSPANN